MILEAATLSKDVEFVFYGSIDPSYTEEFYAAIKTLPNAQYKGVFKGSNPEVYWELAKYDVLLFPTKWETEGVPGMLLDKDREYLRIIRFQSKKSAEKFYVDSYIKAIEAELNPTNE